MLLGGLLYLAVHEPAYESRAAFVLVPADRGAEGSELLRSLLQTGTVGTYEHYLGASDDVRDALPDTVTIAVRSVPDTRVLSLRTIGPRSEVGPALEAVVDLREDVDAALGGLWRLDVVESPQPAARAGAKPWMVLTGAGGLALLAAIGVLALGRRIEGRRARPAPSDPGNGAGTGAPVDPHPGARIYF